MARCETCNCATPCVGRQRLILGKYVFGCAENRRIPNNPSLTRAFERPGTDESRRKSPDVVACFCAAGIRCTFTLLTSTGRPMAILSHHLTRSVSLFLLSQVCFAQTVQLNPTASQTITQPVVGTTRSTLGVNSINNTYYVNQWCSTTGVLDDTCFTNAIHDIVATGRLTTSSPPTECKC
jgi:hypothetical protein